MISIRVDVQQGNRMAAYYKKLWGKARASGKEFAETVGSLSGPDSFLRLVWGGPGAWKNRKRSAVTHHDSR